jgi:hypothetical protein
MVLLKKSLLGPPIFSLMQRWETLMHADVDQPRIEWPITRQIQWAALFPGK